MSNLRRYTEITKYEDEEYTYAVNFEFDLEGRTITTPTVESVDHDTREAAAVASNPAVVGTKIEFTLEGGAYGKRYDVYVNAGLNTGEVIGHLLLVIMR